MPKGNFPFLAFNRGIVSPKALARVDVDRIRLSAEEMTNWIPKTQGAMRIAPGTEYLGSSKDDAEAVWIDFVASTTDTALLELTGQTLRVWIDDEVMAREAVSTTIPNSSFASSTGWTDSSTNGGTLTFGGSGLILNATNRGGLAKCTRQITVAGADQGNEHALRIMVTRGPVTFRCGASSGGDDYITETTLRTGAHSLAFTPTGNFHLTFQSALDRNVIVASITVEASGNVELPAPWLSADLPLLRWAQSADVVFVACDGYQQRRIERRGAGRSWSLVRYEPEDGPFSTGRTVNSVKLKPGATFGNTTLTADRPFFKAGHVGALFRLFQSGAYGRFRLGAEDTYTDAFRVSGISLEESGNAYNDRNWSYTISGTWSGTLRCYRSFDGDDVGFQRFRRADGVSTIDITSNGSFNNDDSDSNSIIWYRIGFEPGAYTSGVAIVDLNYDGGGDYGICRVTGYTSETQVDIEIIRPFRDDVYTDDWREGLWSDYRGWPSSVALYEGRLWWGGSARLIGSVSDSYESFDDDVDGDSGPIIRTLASGPVDAINFMLPLQRLILGTAGSEISIRSTSFDEPLTPSNTNAKDCSTQGSAVLPAAKVDSRGIFVQRSGKRIFELIYDVEAYDYRPRELTILNPDIATNGVQWIAIQRQPDTRVHFGLGDGSVAILTYEPEEEVACFSRWETDGFVERAVVLPGADEDQVYYHIRRAIDGSTKRYLEKWAMESECDGGALCKLAHCLVTYSGSPTATITGLDHLEGKNVIVWANEDAVSNTDGSVREFTVSGGEITLSETTANAVVGLPYIAPYKSTKLAYAAALGTALTQRKRVDNIGLILANTHMRGLEVGRDFDRMDPLPLVTGGQPVAEGTIYDAYDYAGQAFPGEWDTDSRMCLRATAPRPVTVLAAIVSMKTNDRG